MKKMPPTEAPICPTCNNRVWRKNHLLEFQFEADDAEKDSKFVVCMHCSHIWKWLPESEAPLVRPTKAELKIVWPELKPVVQRFNMNRLFAALMPPAGEA